MSLVGQKSGSLISQLRIVTVLLLVSLLPLLLLGFGSWSVFISLSDQKTLELQGTVVAGHARSIELYFDERIRVLRFLIESGLIRYDSSDSILSGALNDLNQSYQNSFIDLGIIDASGHHVSYVGPFNLMDRDYHETEWFQSVREQGTFVSDVFLGFRGIPHLVVAISSGEGETAWILRATINSYQFESIVQSQKLGTSGEAFIVNREGILQTKSRTGEVMQASSVHDVPVSSGVQHNRIREGQVTRIQSTTWINQGRWLLVVSQTEDEIREPVRLAILKGMIVIALAMLLVIVTTLVATRHLSRQIDEANRRREEVQRDFIRSAKLASIGELATGFAHEINNPLAIVAAEQTNIADLVGLADRDFPYREEILESVRTSKKQVERCGNITRKILQFGRRSETKLIQTSLPDRLDDIVNLMNKQAQIRNIKIGLSVEENLPPVQVDPVELEQVLVNLINNAMHAIEDSGQITIRAFQANRTTFIEVIDTGCGIPSDQLDRIFEPFFTTKSVGQGTGLGLSVCYGVVSNWGGFLEVESECGKGSTFRIGFPDRSHGLSRTSVSGAEIPFEESTNQES